MLQRIVAQNIEITANRMHDVANNIQSFLWLTTNSSGVIFENINTAVTTLFKFVVLDDFSRIQQIIKHRSREYYTKHAFAVSSLLQSLNWIIHSIPGIGRASDDVYRDSTLVFHIRHILSIATDNKKMSLVDAVIRRLVLRPNQWKRCHDTFRNFVAILSNSSEVSNTNSVDKNWHVLSSFYDIKDLNPCLHGLKTDLTHVGNENEIMLETIRNIVHFSMLFNYSRFLVGAQDDLSNLQQKALWFSKQMQLYAQNKTTKLDLSKNVTISLINEVEKVINKILTYLDRDIIERLEMLGDTIEKQVRNFYVKGLAAMMTLDAYYNNDDIEEELRMLKIWRQPVFQFSIPKVVGFEYSAPLSWKSWPNSITLQEFVLGKSHDQIVSKVTERYGNGMQHELVRRQYEFTRIKDGIISSLYELLDELKHIQRDSVLNEVFAA